jgi:hypothetical protein
MSWVTEPSATASAYSGPSGNGATKRAEDAAAATAAAARRCPTRYSQWCGQGKGHAFALNTEPADGQSAIDV